MKHVPLRSCVVCRAQKDKSQLLRVVKRPDGSFAIDASGREPGRGAYVCKAGDCMPAAIKKHALDRVFKQQLPAQTYLDLGESYKALSEGGE